MYRFTPAFFNDFPEARENLNTGTRDMIASNTITKFANAFSNAKYDGAVGIYARCGNVREMKYIDGKYVQKNAYLDTFNVFVPQANGSGTFGEPLATPVIGQPVIGHTDTFISIGTFNTEDEANACLKYIKTKFARALLGILKITQSNARDKWRFVPLQDFTPSSDIDWSLPVPQIDEQLYAKYGLSDEEIDFIESHVKAMA